MLPFPFRHFPPLGPGKIKPRQRVVAQWRGIDLAPLEKARARRAESISALLPKVLSDLRIDRRRAEAEVVPEVQEVPGDRRREDGGSRRRPFRRRGRERPRRPRPPGSGSRSRQRT